MAEVANLYASLSLHVQASSWKQADAMIKQLGRRLAGLEKPLKKTRGMLGGAFGGLGKLGLAGMGLSFLGRGFDKAKSAFIDFNSSIEDTKNQIAGMMALATHTDLTDNLGKADKMMANLQARAAKLPGTTAEYANMLGRLTQPILDAKLGMKDLEDLTVNSVIAAKGLHVDWEVAARDIEQALAGQYHAIDPFSRNVLGSIGYKGEAGRKKYNALSAAKRATEYKRALMQKQFTQLGEAQGGTFSGMMSTLQDTIQRTLGKVGMPLFKAVSAHLKQWLVWLDKNSAKIERIATIVGHYLLKAFEFVGAVVEKLVEGISEAYEELAADEDVRNALNAIKDAIKFILPGFVTMAKNIKYFILVAFAPLKTIAFLVRKVGEGFTWLRDIAISMGTAVRDFLGGIVDWISAKIDAVRGKIEWIIDKAKAVGGFAMKFSPAGQFVNALTGTPSATGPMTSMASRVVPPAPTGAPPTNVQLQVQVKQNGGMPWDQVDTRVDTKIKDSNESIWRQMSAAVGGEEP